MSTNKDFDAVRDAIATALRRTLGDLYTKHPGHYYYITLITTGEGHAPVFAAWSREELARAVKSTSNPEEATSDFKWSYADSPFLDYGKEYFDTVNSMLKEYRERRMDSTQHFADFVLDAMEAALSAVDSEGLFGRGKERSQVLINAEIMPPDPSNTERARRLNPPDSLSAWLQEAAE